MDKEKLIARLMTTFLAELSEHLRALDHDVLALEKDQEPGHAELLKTLFRTVHSLKGAARSVNVGPIEAACHRLEAILADARDGLAPVGPELIQLLLTSADAFRDASTRLQDAQDLSGGPLAALLLHLDARGQGRSGPAPRGASVSPPPASVSPTPASVTPTPSRVSPTPGPLSPTPASVSPTPSRVSPTPGPLSPTPGPPPRDGVIRVAAQKLDALLARSSELSVARRRAESRREELHQLQETLEQARAEWRRLEKPLRRLLALEPSLSGASVGSRRAALAVQRTQDNLHALSRSLEVFTQRTLSDQHVLEQASVPLEDEVRRLRMLPFGDACEGLERVARDLGRAGGKEVDLVVDGQDVELDRSILEGLRDPLMQLVRNAVDHGLEEPAARLAAGKPRRGCVTVVAALRGAGVEVLVIDDGRGLDLDSIRAQALKRHLSVNDEHELAQLVFQPGFSTAPLITELSGRGVGLDVVKHRVESMHGAVDFSFEPGRGTRFALTLPLTLTTQRALVVRCRGQSFALSTSSVRRLLRVEPEALGLIEGREVLLSDGVPIPVVELAAVLGLGGGTRRAPGKLLLVIIGSAGHSLALAVDELLAEHELLVKSLGRRLGAVRHFAGGSTLQSGQVVLFLNAAELIETALALTPQRRLRAEAPTAPRKRLLVVDDSVTTRCLEKSILEGAGFEVVVAPDGVEAWRLLQDGGADLVVADVEMPRLDGFGLTRAIRDSKRFHSLPVVLVTALASERDQARGLEAGADAYVIKSGFDQRLLLDTITQLV